MTRPVVTSALLALALSLGACGGTVNRGMESVHQPVVSRTDYVMDVGADAGGLAPGEPERLEAWFASLGLGYGDRIAIEDPSAYGDSAARDAVARLAARKGLLVADVAPVTAGEVAPGSVRVVVSRTTAEVPGCPDWSRASSPEFAGSTMSNYGCGVNSTLAAMVANKDDLIRGQDPAGGTDASTATKAIKQYRDRPPTGAGDLKQETKGGN